MGYKTELHCHSGVVSACGRLSPERIVERYVEQGYTTLVITDHMNRATFGMGNYAGKDDWDKKVDFFMSSYNMLQKVAAGRLNILLGMEARLDKHDATDYLVYGVTEDFLRANTGLLSYHLKDFSKAVRGAGMLLVQAHPFRDNIVVTPPRYLDGVEVYNGHERQTSVFRNEMAALWAKHYDLIPTSGSDLHEECMTITGGIETDEPITTNEQLLSVLRSRSYNILRNEALFDPDKK
ncbi:MAG: PHP domain-containing protein [Clostridia bacterium]|nr:PHP domain-containing protein [Clostridia bacterium]